MAKFLWFNSYEWNIRTSHECYCLLRKTIEKYGVNTRDDNNCSIFNLLDIFTGHINFYKCLDLIFEYKPVLFPDKCIDMSDMMMMPCILKNHAYLFKRILQEDTEFKYIRYCFKYDGVYYSNFYQYLENCFNKGWIYESRSVMAYMANHYYKGITFFEMMKHRLFK